MVHREDSNGLILISQPAHSWVSGQLARHWGNVEFGAVKPSAELCLAAEMHDVGFLSWELAPTLHPETGRPHDFMHMPTPPHLALWAESVRQLSLLSRYAALLVSLHVSHLCQNNKVTREQQDAKAVQDFVNEQQAVQASLLSGLRKEPAYGEWTAEAMIQRNQRLLATWDWISLILCIGKPGEQSAKEAPSATGLETLRLVTPQEDRCRITIAPWPFQTQKVRIHCDARRLPDSYEDETLMRAALRNAEYVSLAIELAPG